MYPIRSRKLQPSTSLDRLRFRAGAAGASRPMESSSDSPAHPRIPPDPEEQWSSLCQMGSCLASQKPLQNVPRGMGCWHRTGARQPSWHLGGQPSVDAWFQPTLTHNTSSLGQDPIPNLSLLPSLQTSLPAGTEDSIRDLLWSALPKVVPKCKVAAWENCVFLLAKRHQKTTKTGKELRNRPFDMPSASLYKGT